MTYIGIGTCMFLISQAVSQAYVHKSSIFTYDNLLILGKNTVMFWNRELLFHILEHLHC
jgi:hypothetical protein